MGVRAARSRRHVVSPAAAVVPGLLAIGLIVGRHQPRNPMGWVLFGLAFLDAVDLGAVRADMMSVMHDVFEPTHVSVSTMERAKS